MAVIVPFRDLHIEQNRKSHLKRFAPHLVTFLSSKSSSSSLSSDQYKYKLFIIEQSNDSRKFNRGKLLNVGYVEAKKQGERRGAL